MKKTYRGSCHCGKVRFEADIDFASGSGRCNCSICTKLRWWGVMVKPADFRLLAGDYELGDYQFGTGQCHHMFCRTCGVHAFGRGELAQVGGAFCAANVACLDDVDPAELIAMPVHYADGRNNNWGARPAEVRHL